MTYAYLDNFLGKRGERHVPSIRATTVHRGTHYRYRDESAYPAIAVRYHGTTVVTALANGEFILNSGGYCTATTKKRIKAYSPAVLYQERHVWYLAPRNADGSINHDRKARVKFYDGMRIDAAGNVLPRE